MSDYRRLELIGRDPRPFSGALAGEAPGDPRSGWLACETYYGMREKPFALGSDPRFFYRSQPHAAAYENLLSGIRRRESLSVLSGEIGTGKTTLCRAVLQSLDRQTFSAFVPDPFASREDLLKMVLLDFGVVSVDDFTSGRLHVATRTELSYLLYEFLRKLSPLQAFAVVVIDEAQNLSSSLLEEIRILSDSGGRERQLQVVLVGQPELQEKLTLWELRQVEQRISVRCSLEPLTREGIAGYVSHRLKVAEGTPDRISFSQDAIDFLHDVSGGVPRLINRICDRALHHGHLKQAASIDAALIQQAVDDIGLKRSKLLTSGSPRQPALGRDQAPGQDQAQADTQRVDESVEVWLSSIGTHPQTTERGCAAPPVSAGAPATQSGNNYTGCFPATLPPTYLQRLGRRWLLRMRTVALWTACVTAAGILVAYGWRASQYRQLKEAIVLPALPSAPPASLKPALKPVEQPADPQYAAQPATHTAAQFWVQIALFKTQGRAQAVVSRLEQAGYPAYRVSLGSGEATRHQVIAGPYSEGADARADVERLRRSREFGDVRVVHLAP